LSTLSKKEYPPIFGYSAILAYIGHSPANRKSNEKRKISSREEKNLSQCPGFLKPIKIKNYFKNFEKLF